MEIGVIGGKRKKRREQTRRFPVVGIGASAGGLEAMKELLKALPNDTGMALIFVQHLDPTHESLAPEILSRATQMPILEVKEGMRIEPDHVYMIPPNFKMAVLHNVLSLLPLRAGPRGQHLVIDSFFHSLALDQKENAIGVILSGTASDGTLGLKAIKSKGGLAIAQDPKSAKYTGMPESAIASGFVDLTLSPQEIARELERISKHPRVPTTRKMAMRSEGVEAEPADALRKIFVLLRAQTKIDFSNYKRATVMRRIQRRMAARKAKNISAYAKELQDNPDEIKALYDDMLIHVTEFFRDPVSFKALQQRVFPQLIKNRIANAPIRIWVPGCSTGEEAYSIAILLIEYLTDVREKIPVQIFATDISEQAIQAARLGVYSRAIEDAVSKNRLELFFKKEGAGYKINKNIRDLCLFSKHDLINDPPYSKLDLVSCRNVLIYFDPVLQKQVIPIFHYALNPGGFLFLGKSESLGEHSRLFMLVDKLDRIYSRANIPTPVSLRSPIVYEPNAKSITGKVFEAKRESGDFQRDAARIALSRYAPSFVIANANMDILQFHGRTAPCLEPMSGVPSNNLFKMARQELLHGLRATIQSATQNNAPARLEGISFDVEDKRRTFNLQVVPANPLHPPKQRNYVIFFEEVSSHSLPKQTKIPRGKKTTRDKQSQRILQLEEDLLVCRQSQKSLTEAFETAQDELASANEELQSANEELQSTNEELETSKEELQSSNEELTTVNDELQTRNENLLVLSGDLNNVLNSVEMPIVIVDGKLRVRRFTTNAEKVFNLIASDVGRPLSDIKPNFEGDLESMVSETIKSLRPQEKEIFVNKSNWMRIQVRPYRAINNRIDGAVITLVDITLLKEHLTKSQAALKYTSSVADTLPLPLVVLDEQLHILSANHGFAKTFEIVPHKEIGSDLISVLGGKGWKTPHLRELLLDVISKNHELVDLEIEHDFPELGHRILLLNARQVQWQDTMPKALLLSIDDITKRKELELALEHSEERFRTVVESAHDAILIVNSEGKIEFTNQQALKWFGYAAGDLEGKAVETLIPERFRDAQMEDRWRYVGEATARPRGEGRELVARRRDGSEFPVDISLSPMKTADEIKVTAIIRDISETKKLSLERELLLEQEKLAHADADRARADADRANATKDIFLATLSHELRTPLSSILSWSQLIQKSNFDPEKLRHGVPTIERSAKIQGQLIDDLLDVARIQSGKLAIRFNDVDLRETVKAAVEAVHTLAEKKHIIVEVETGLIPMIIWGDSDRLQQVVWNLLTNAIKFSPEGGTVRVQVEPIKEANKDLVAVKVIDHGKGIRSEFLPKLFERFSQADSSSIRVHGGLGLGLALVRDLTQLHGGSVRAESEGLGKGATFMVFLPVKSNAAQRTDEKNREASEQPVLTGLSVMIVEDEPTTLEVLDEALTSFGAKTILCASAAEALSSFEKLKPDILVSDIAMPGEDGYSLIRKIRELGPQQNGDIPSLALTAYATEDDLNRATAAGFNSHLAKPFDNLLLGQVVANLAGRRKSPRI